MAISLVYGGPGSVISVDGNVSDGDTVLVVCDCSSYRKTVKLPDLLIRSNIFIKIVKSDSTSNIVYVYCAVPGQQVKYDDHVVLTSKGQTLELVSDRVRSWV